MRDSYGSVPVTAAFLAEWREEVSAALAAVVAGFEEKYGYGPGENAVRSPEPADRVAADRLAAESPGFADLAAFYGAIGAVDMGDIGNGYFLHSASRAVIERIELPEAGGTVPAVLIGSDGGGILYAVAADGAVWRSRTASEDGEFERITGGLAEFLDLLRRSVHRFQESGQPGLV
ncbi:SMI1/KNR4 family protein [Streptomyces sp. WAC07061]|uniref:SMI1/KNR4 family protein n=1 Tax=Streptomyces sp. WAC07061 TaxID=2487410 RepID=UPI000F779D69|nr:SMI1/KNR4 family protein [Streptomyces sp. WAC07061]RSS38667.1 SMI1/KNR4 family protein [Streptomyces sp. WAC07061]